MNMYKKYKIIDDRLFYFKILVYFSFLIIIINMLDIFFINGSIYEDKLNIMLNNVYNYKSTPRGRIYDRNLKLLVDNKMIPVLSYIKSDNKQNELLLVDLLSNIIDIDYKKVSDRNKKDYKVFKML